MKCYFNSFARTSNGLPTFIVLDTDVWSISPQEATGYVQLLDIDIPLRQFDDTAEEIITKLPCLATPEEHAPGGTQAINDQAGSTRQTLRWNTFATTNNQMFFKDYI
jgi:hypothetical protein